MSFIAIGDLHFKHSNILECEIIYKKIIENVQKINPTFVVLLGDLLDTHNVVYIQPYKMICKLIEELSEICEVYVLIGNHDLINHTQFLTDNHPFNPLKKWKNVFIVDVPIILKKEGKSFFMCPYVPDGKFFEALNNIEWKKCDYGFGHQLINGCNMGGIIANSGDDWKEEYPIIFMGHIHEPQYVDGVYYIGDITKGKVLYFDIIKDTFKKIDIGIKKKKIINTNTSITLEDLKEYMKYSLKIVVSGKNAELKNFKKSKEFYAIRREGINIVFKLIEEFDENTNFKKYSGVDYSSILKEMIHRTNDTELIKEYENIF